MARDWTAVVDGPDFSDVMRLVHLAARMDSVDEDRIAAELTKVRRRAYEREVTIQLGRAGCAGRHGSLTAGLTLTEFAEQARTDAQSIVNTYNWELAREIRKIASLVPPANRFTYAKRIGEWDAVRAEAKAAQIAGWTEGTARSRAQKDFVFNNGLGGTARLEPRIAVCQICAGWLKRGKIPLAEILSNPPPYHPNCVHGLVTRYDRVRPEECAMLWAGE